ncbi:hypothetical protein OROGR_030306 [Orobanche gracilis]
MDQGDLTHLTQLTSLNLHPFRSFISQQRLPHTNEAGAVIDAVKAVGENTTFIQMDKKPSTQSAGDGITRYTVIMIRLFVQGSGGESPRTASPPTPLWMTSSNMSGGHARPIRLVDSDENERFHMDPEAVALLQLVKQPVGVVPVCGLARQGKISILDQLQGNIANDLYSEISQSSSIELDSGSTAVRANGNLHVERIPSYPMKHKHFPGVAADSPDSGTRVRTRRRHVRKTGHGGTRRRTRGTLLVSRVRGYFAGVAESDHSDWYDDESSYEDSVEKLNKANENLDREWRRRHNQFHTVGYRDGLIAGKETAAQEGFNIGFKDSVLSGYNLGLVRGITSAMACLPGVLKEKLVETEETRNKFGQLHESVQSLSTMDALKLFYEDGKMKLSEQQESRDISVLKNYHRLLQSLVAESPPLEVN